VARQITRAAEDAALSMVAFMRWRKIAAMRLHETSYARSRESDGCFVAAARVVRGGSTDSEEALQDEKKRQHTSDDRTRNRRSSSALSETLALSFDHHAAQRPKIDQLQ
jgi:hypothetical protein